MKKEKNKKPARPAELTFPSSLMLLFGSLPGSGAERFAVCRYCHKPAHMEHMVRAYRYCEATLVPDQPNATDAPMRIKLHNVLTAETLQVKLPLNATLRHVIEHLARKQQKPVCSFVLHHYSIGKDAGIEHFSLAETRLSAGPDDLEWVEPVWLYYSMTE